ncbi:MAG: M3 family metallopeptidase [Spirochaetaceae bacterium]
MKNNPIISTYDNKYEAIPFNDIKIEHFIPSFEIALKEAYINISNIKNQNNEPTFTNTIEALEMVSSTLDKVTSIYFNLYSLHSESEFKKLSEIISPKLAKFSGDIFTDGMLFTKVETIFNKISVLDLSIEELRLLNITYKSFTRNGALLSDNDKIKLQQIDEELSLLSPKFSKNVLDAVNEFMIHLTDEKKIEGIPKNAISAAKSKATEKGFDNGWVFTLQMPSYIPVIQYADNRELRKKLSKAYGIKNLSGNYDNRETILDIISLKDQRAKLLGYENHANYTLEKRMANSPDIVMSFLNNILEKSLPAAKKELEELQKIALKDGIEELQSWDFAYYSQKLKKQRFNFDQEELRPYFKAENVLDGIFVVAKRMYNLIFTEINDVQVYHPEVKTYRVEDSKLNFIGLLYIDLYPRETKQGGAWMNTFRTQGLQDGEIKRPHILISGNLTPSTSDTPSLLSFDEVRTVFHEFGHALHGLLSDVKYCSLASPNVMWDFVELPSQIMENWLLESETLEIFAKHYKTDEIIPLDLINKLKETQTFNAGSNNNRQLSLGFLDMAWHSTDPKTIKDVEEFEETILEKTRLLPNNESNTSTGFSHIFAGGYSAGYYSYKWAEVLDADAFELFKENGIFDLKTASSFAENILSKGNTVEPMELYKKFRGSEPDVTALLKRDGLI